jgi:hypothetical protein
MLFRLLCLEILQGVIEIVDLELFLKLLVKFFDYLIETLGDLEFADEFPILRGDLLDHDVQGIICYEIHQLILKPTEELPLDIVRHPCLNGIDAEGNRRTGDHMLQVSELVLESIVQVGKLLVHGLV